jgi:hypothetical protein
MIDPDDSANPAQKLGCDDVVMRHRESKWLLVWLSCRVDDVHSPAGWLRSKVAGSNFVATLSTYATDTVCKLWNESKPQELWSRYAKSYVRARARGYYQCCV